MNTCKFQHSAHPVLLIGDRCVNDVDTTPVVMQLRCLHMVLHSPDNHSMKAVQLIYVMIE